MIMIKPTLEDWVWVGAMLNQAMIGMISTNVRQICLTYEDGWKISVVLERPCEQDIDDIQDLADETSILLIDIKNRISFAANSGISTSFICHARPLENPLTADCRIVFRRKEIRPDHSCSDSEL
jgi:hypothetical protein